MSISAIGSVTAPVTAAQTQSQTSDSAALKEKLAAMAQGQSVSSGGSGDDSSDEETRIVTRTQADGSQIIMVMQGTKIISERKVGGDSNSEDKATIAINTEILNAGSQLPAAASDAKINQYEAGNAIASGLVFNAGV